MIDIHSHILPCIDDGSESAQESFDMIVEAFDAGFTDIITTSHFITGTFEINKKDRQSIIDALQNKIDSYNINLKLHNGAESYIMPELVEFYSRGIIPSLANSRYVLFEFPMHSIVLYGNNVISDLKRKGYIPVIAHPERYDYVQKNIEIAYDWINQGALLQSNYGSILEQYGKDAKKTFLKLLKNKSITFLGTDCHAKKSVYTRVNMAIDEISKYTDENYIEKLIGGNQEKVLNNEIISQENY